MDLQGSPFLGPSCMKEAVFMLVTAQERVCVPWQHQHRATATSHVQQCGRLLVTSRARTQL